MTSTAVAAAHSETSATAASASRLPESNAVTPMMPHTLDSQASPAIQTGRSGSRHSIHPNTRQPTTTSVLPSLAALRAAVWLVANDGMTLVSPAAKRVASAVPVPAMNSTFHALNASPMATVASASTSGAVRRDRSMYTRTQMPAMTRPEPAIMSSWIARQYGVAAMTPSWAIGSAGSIGW